MRNNQPPAQQSPQQLFAQSAACLQAGDIIKAKKGFIRLSKKLPDSASVHYNLGLCHQHLGQHEKAITAYLKSCRIKPDQPDGWVNAGISYLQLQQPEKAEQAIRKSLDLNPHHARGLNSLGTLQASRGQYEQAKTNFNQSIAIQPDYTDPKINLANLESSHNNHAEALSIVDALLASSPHHRKALLIKASALVGSQDYKAAAPIVLALEDSLPPDLSHDMSSDAPDKEEIMRLGVAFREAIGDHSGVIDKAEKLLQQFPRDAALWHSLAVACFRLGATEKSSTHYQKAVALEPQNPEFITNLGLACAVLGDRQNAELHYRRALDLDPQHAEAYRRLTALRQFKSLDDPDAEHIIEIWKNPELDDLTRTRMAFAVGKIYHDCGSYDDAFEACKVGNDLKSGRQPGLDPTVWLEPIERIPEVLNSAPLITAGHRPTPQPIFILGMPGSGTALVEQIITRHSQVHRCGPLPAIEHAIGRLEKTPTPTGTMPTYPDDFRVLNRSQLESGAEQYLASVKRLHDIKPGCDRLTDSMPFNFAHVWLIRAMFPHAAIVYCRRHPLDVIMANYFRLHDDLDSGFACDLESLAKYHIGYHRLMNTWKTLFGDHIHDVIHEQLTTDIENQTRQLIDAVNLPWEDNCLQNQPDSTEQTTDPHCNQYWKNYRTQLQHAIAILQHENILDADGNWPESV